VNYMTAQEISRVGNYGLIQEERLYIKNIGRVTDAVPQDDSHTAIKAEVYLRTEGRLANGHRNRIYGEISLVLPDDMNLEVNILSPFREERAAQEAAL
jgi:hypothetical protein